MRTTVSLPFMAFLGLHLARVFAAPTTDLEARAPLDEVPMITKEIDCVLFDTPESCDTFCFATFCMGFPDIL